MSKLFEPLTLRRLTFKNRIFVSPMCQYSCENGVPNDWHLVHLGSRAVGGAALVMVEATGVTPEGRITPGDMGLWNEEQSKAFVKITNFIKSQHCIPGIQLAHAGRKASAELPWRGGNALKTSDAWTTLAPSALAFDHDWPTPHAMRLEEIRKTVDAFVDAAKRARAAGFEVVEVHLAHGYLLHEFLSPISNQRTDQYGGTLENRMRFPLEVVRAVRAAWPEEWPVFARISASDWDPRGFTDTDSVVLAKALKDAGVDLVDCSSGGIAPHIKIPNEPGYQVRFSEKVKREAGIPTGAVGLITEANQAEAIIASEKADVVSLAREMLRDPYFPLHAAKALGVNIPWPKQYERAQK